ncbi:FAD-dependent monooxygenase [Nocardia beijingensis]|uniref:FAD-dependent monooxygenase n=1 Tax=Nocardia beijingensis TaxID=95162 RepID=UPI00332D9124
MITSAALDGELTKLQASRRRAAVQAEHKRRTSLDADRSAGYAMNDVVPTRSLRTQRNLWNRSYVQAIGDDSARMGVFGIERGGGRMAALRVAIIGAGIGGLTTAIALRDRGIDATVYDQAKELKGLGAGVSIAPNGSLVLCRLGLSDRVSAIAGHISNFTFRTWQSEPVGDPAQPAVPGDPARTWTLHRGEFQKVLREALSADTIRLDRRCVGAVETDFGVTVNFSDGSALEADLVVGADGIHSRMQSVVGHPAVPISEGIMAYRSLIPADRLDGIADMQTQYGWFGPGQSFVAYPVSAGTHLNIVAFVPTDLDVLESWNAPGEVSDLVDLYRGWDPLLLNIICAAEHTFRWGIYDREPLTSWSTDRITLLGDAAHAVVPHLGQGANQAIEDAITLAVLLEDARAQDIPQRLKIYESLRIDRTRTVRHQARRAGVLYRTPDLNARELARRLTEIYASIEVDTYDAEQIAQDALAAHG